MSLKQKSIKGLFWDFTGRLGLQGVGFFVSIILARILVPEDFGVLAIITVFINLAGVFMDLGFSTALVQRKEVNESHYASVFYLNVGMGFLLASIVFLAAPFVASFYENPHLTNLTRVMSLSFIVNSFGNVARAQLRREMNFKLMSYASIASAIISGAIAVYMAYNGYGVWSLVIQLIVGQLLSNIFLYLGCKLHFSLHFSFYSLKELWGFSSKLFFTGLLDTLFSNIDSLLIGKLLNPATLGYYYRAKSLENFGLRYTASTLSSVLLPSLSSIQNDTERLKHAVLKLYKLISFISFLVCGVLLVGARELIILLFSLKWEPSVLLFQIIIAGAFAPQIYYLPYNVFISTGNIKSYFRLNIINKVLISLNFIVLFYGNLNKYLIIGVFIQILIFYIGLNVMSKKIGLGKVLYLLSIKDLFIYSTAVTISFSAKYFCSISNLYLSFLFSVSIFITVFICSYYLLNKEYLFLITTELKALFNKNHSVNNL